MGNMRKTVETYSYDWEWPGCQGKPLLGTWDFKEEKKATLHMKIWGKSILGSGKAIINVLRLKHFSEISKVPQTRVFTAEWEKKKHTWYEIRKTGRGNITWGPPALVKGLVFIVSEKRVLWVNSRRYMIFGLYSKKDHSGFSMENALSEIWINQNAL